MERVPGPCPANPVVVLRRQRGRRSPTTPGPAVVDDTDAQTPGGTWCYGVRFREPGYQAAPTLFLLQVDGVPEPPNAPPVASFRAFPTEGSITDGTNEVFLSDDSSDLDGQHRRLAVGPGRRDGVRRRAFSHVYTAPGTYTVTLRVTDDRGATATATQTITILP